MKITMAQLNPVIGDFAGNLAQIEKTLEGVQGSRARPGGVPRVIPDRLSAARPAGARLVHPADAGRQWTRCCELSRRYPETGILIGAPMPTGLTTGQRAVQLGAADLPGRDPVRTEQDAAAHLRRIRRGPLFRLGARRSA